MDEDPQLDVRMRIWIREDGTGRVVFRGEALANIAEEQSLPATPEEKELDWFIGGPWVEEVMSSISAS